METEGSNLELAREAAVTSDCERQCELAEMGSAVVLSALRRNSHLCERAEELLRQAEQKIQGDIASAVGEVVAD